MKIQQQYATVYWNLDWSPDEKRIAFNAQNRASGQNELLLVSRQNPEQIKTLYQGLHRQHVDHCWSPDGKQILIPLQLPESIGPQLFLIDPTGQQPPHKLATAPQDRLIYGAD